jgi:hypothetical protein
MLSRCLEVVQVYVPRVQTVVIGRVFEMVDQFSPRGRGDNKQHTVAADLLHGGGVFRQVGIRCAKVGEK